MYGRAVKHHGRHSKVQILFSLIYVWPDRNTTWPTDKSRIGLEANTARSDTMGGEYQSPNCKDRAMLLVLKRLIFNLFSFIDLN
jgi:hypothetical protein